jgi:hypothetical protein
MGIQRVSKHVQHLPLTGSSGTLVRLTQRAILRSSAGTKLHCGLEFGTSPKHRASSSMPSALASLAVQPV